jgi:urease subunit alpha
MHLYHIEGAGGGHAPDIMEMVAEPNIVPSSTNPTNPFTVNTYDEHLEMIMVVHHLNPEVPEDVAFAESRIRNETIAAEDVLHDTGVISMFGTDSQGMGRQGELICRTWQVADSMKRQRGPLPEDEDTGADNYRIKRYMAKYTINPAITAGIEPYVGSIESGKLADLCIWEPEFFGIKPHTVFKSGFPVTSNQGKGNGSLITAQPRKQREVYGACGQAKHELSVQFASQAAVDNDIGSEYGLSTPVLPVKNTRNLTKEHMLHNTTRPDNIDVDSETHEVRIDEELITCEPQEEIPMAQQYML